jgi:hypothetical protein
MANEPNQGQQSGGQQQKENPSGQQQPGQKKSNESGEQGSQGNELQRRTPGREQEQGNEQLAPLVKGKKKLRTKESAHKEQAPSFEGAIPYRLVKISPSEMGRGIPPFRAAMQLSCRDLLTSTT